MVWLSSWLFILLLLFAVLFWSTERINGKSGRVEGANQTPHTTLIQRWSHISLCLLKVFFRSSFFRVVASVLCGPRPLFSCARGEIWKEEWLHKGHRHARRQNANRRRTDSPDTFLGREQRRERKEKVTNRKKVPTNTEFFFHSEESTVVGSYVQKEEKE